MIDNIELIFLLYFNSLKVKEKYGKKVVEQMIEFIFLFYFNSLKVKEKCGEIDVEQIIEFIGSYSCQALLTCS